MSTLLETIRGRCVEVGECWEWQGACNTRSQSPFMKFNGRPILVRRALAIELGKRVTGKCVTVKCGTRTCVNPEHFVLLTRSELSSRTAATIDYRNPLRVARISASVRRSSVKLTPEDAEAIRVASAAGVRRYVLAEQYGVALSTITSIVHGRTWRDYSSPWLQLLNSARNP